MVEPDLDKRLWNYYSRHYDVLAHAQPYQDLLDAMLGHCVHSDPTILDADVERGI